MGEVCAVCRLTFSRGGEIAISSTMVGNAFYLLPLGPGISTQSRVRSRPRVLYNHQSDQILGGPSTFELRFSTLSNTDYLFSVGTGGSLESKDMEVHWQSVVCSGPAFIRAIPQYFGDQGFIFRDSENIATAPNYYIPKGTTVIENLSLGSIRNVNGCQVSVQVWDVMPVFLNDPAVTGVSLTEGDFDRPIVIGR